MVLSICAFLWGRGGGFRNDCHEFLFFLRDVELVERSLIELSIRMRLWNYNVESVSNTCYSTTLDIDPPK